MPLASGLGIHDDTKHKGSAKRAVASGVAPLDATSKVPIVNTPDVLPTGIIVPYGAAAAPTGYILCNGAAISRTTYAALFAVIGDAYGVGDGSTTFNLPDMQGNIPVGIGGSSVVNLGDVGGATTHTHNRAAGGGKMSDGPDELTSESNMQPYQAVNYIIKI